MSLLAGSRKSNKSAVPQSGQEEISCYWHRMMMLPHLKETACPRRIKLLDTVFPHGTNSPLWNHHMLSHLKHVNTTSSALKSLLCGISEASRTSTACQIIFLLATRRTFCIWRIWLLATFLTMLSALYRAMPRNIHKMFSSVHTASAFIIALSTTCWAWIHPTFLRKSTGMQTGRDISFYFHLKHLNPTPKKS